MKITADKEMKATIVRVGLDTAKQYIQMHGVDACEQTRAVQTIGAETRAGILRQPAAVPDLAGGLLQQPLLDP